MSTLTDKITETLREAQWYAASTEGTAVALAAVVSEWLSTDLDLLTLAEDEHGMRRFDAADLLLALAAEAAKGVDA